jgi:phage terminase large subunit-like protein
VTQRLLTLQTLQVCVYVLARERERERETEADIMLCACECANMCVPARWRALKTNRVASIQHDDNPAGLAAQIYYCMRM